MGSEQPVSFLGAENHQGNLGSAKREDLKEHGPPCDDPDSQNRAPQTIADTFPLKKKNVKLQ